MPTVHNHIEIEKERGSVLERERELKRDAPVYQSQSYLKFVGQLKTTDLLRTLLSQWPSLWYYNPLKISVVEADPGSWCMTAVQESAQG